MQFPNSKIPLCNIEIVTLCIRTLAFNNAIGSLTIWPNYYRV